MARHRRDSKLPAPPTVQPPAEPVAPPLTGPQARLLQLRTEVAHQAAAEIRAPADRLARLDTLLARHLITQAEHAERRRAIIDGL
jgi:hypothetical protein